MMMSPSKGETATHGCQGDMVVRMSEILARPWGAVCVPLALSLSCDNTLKSYFFQISSFSHAYLVSLA